MRPTGLVDPEVVVKPTKGQIDDLMAQINERVTKGDRVLVTTLTKKMAEDLTDYLLELGVRVRYLHSEVDTIQRIEILRGLRLGEFDVLVGHQPPAGGSRPARGVARGHPRRRQGGLPALARRSLIQTIGRAARNVDGQVVMYADTVTDSMQRAISETNRRRRAAGGRTTPSTASTRRPSARRSPTSSRCSGRTRRSPDARGKDRRNRSRDQRRVAAELAELPQNELARLIQTLEEEMHEASADLRFEYAARLRDEIKDLKRELREVG